MPAPPEGQPTFRITDELAQVRIWELVEARVTLAVECVSCHRTAEWPPEMVRERLKASLANRLVMVAGRFRCADCRSPYVRISRARGAAAASDTGANLRPDPALKRGFGAQNLDANARGAGLPRRR